MFLRIIETLYGLVSLIIFGVVVFIIVCPLVILGPTLPIRRFIGRIGVRIALLCIGIPMRIKGLENVPDGVCVAVSNHASYIDGVVLTSALPARFTFVVQDGAASWPYVGLVIRRMGVTFVNRSSPRQGANQTRDLIRRVQQGQSLAIFAEGTFVAEPGLMPFKKGAFMIAAKGGALVLPVCIRGTRRFFGSGSILPRWSPIEIEMCPAIPVNQDAAQLSDAARAAISPICGEPDLALVAQAGEIA
tara:strand:- start:8775 stop:9512 length:738 start_codon:yes stop_codon:yes gene_type:complete